MEGTLFDIGQYFNVDILGMPDLSPKSQENSVMSIVAVWQEEVTNIILDSYANYQVIRLCKGEMLTQLPVPVRSGYEFGGWKDAEGNYYVNGTIWDGPYGNLTLNAQWLPIQYNITYDLNGGTNNNNPSQYDATMSIIFNAPSRLGYRFINWTDATGNVVSHINSGTVGDINLTANWLGVEYEYNNIPSTITAPVNVLNFDNLLGDFDRSLNISSTCFELTLIGGVDSVKDILGIELVVENRNSELIIRLYNCNLYGMDFRSVINSPQTSNVELISDGLQNNIIGGRNNDYSYAIATLDMSIFAN